MLLSRSDRGLLAQWWFTVDRALLSAILLLMAMGVLIAMAASPPVAERIGFESFHFVKNQLLYLIPAAPLFIGMSLLTPAQARRSAILITVASLALMAAALVWGQEVKGAYRWITIGSFTLQPSELAKPGFVVIIAWLLAERLRRPEMPGHLLAFALLALFVALLVMQPDFGQTALVIFTFGALMLVYGISWIAVLGFASLVAAASAAAYLMVPHVASRVDRFFNPEAGDNFQVEAAIQAFRNGGVLGAGPGGGEAKRIIPDAHSDFSFAVVGEEFGLIACLALMMLFAFIVLRLLARAKAEPDPFPALAMTGLVGVFGFQAIINMAVNVSLMPAKGMTLPFISYGGSSLMGMALAMGLALAFARRRPGNTVSEGGWLSRSV